MLTLQFPWEKWYPHVTAYTPFTLCPIILDFFLENIALENITGGASTANVMISSGNFWPKCRCTRSFDAIEVCFYQILPNMTLEIITGGNSNTNDTISRGELKH